MRYEPRDNEPKVNMVLRSSASIGEVDGVTNMEARESFTSVSTQDSRDQLELDRDSSMLTTFLETCIKLLHDNREIRGCYALNLQNIPKYIICEEKIPRTQNSNDFIIQRVMFLHVY